MEWPDAPLRLTEAGRFRLCAGTHQLYTAPPSAPVVVEGLGLRDALLRARAKLSDGEWDGLCRMFREQDNIIRTQRNRLAQQPAAVDGAMELVRDIAEQKPEKPDYWSSCSQCERNIDRAQEVLATQHQEPTS